MDKDNLLYFFHHVHHRAGKHEVHHCGGPHKKIDARVNYKIVHCRCGQHRINKNPAIGHLITEDLKQKAIKIKFSESCPQGGWHIESGRVAENKK